MELIRRRPSLPNSWSIAAVVVVCLHGCGGRAQPPLPPLEVVQGHRLKLATTVDAIDGDSPEFWSPGVPMFLIGELDSPERVAGGVHIQMLEPYKQGWIVILAKGGLPVEKSTDNRYRFSRELTVPEKPGRYRIIAKYLGKEVGRVDFTVK